MLSYKYLGSTECAKCQNVISKSIVFQIKVVEDMKDAQRQLYQWRMEFFHENFKSLFFNPDQEAPNWITLGLDDSHTLDTVPFQITQNFDEVLKLASTRRVLDPNQYEHFYFKNNEWLSFRASFRFERDQDEEEEDGHEVGNKEEIEESAACDCGCQTACEEEQWENQAKRMEMEWEMMAIVNNMQMAFLGNDEA